MELKDAFKELARFAKARARGATVVTVEGRTFDGSLGSTGRGIDADYFMFHPIKEIIEPTVTRPWNAEDAKKHIGFAYRSTAGFIMIIGLSSDGRPPADDYYWQDWPGDYATPVPGTDPATWDWKPCVVEVPADKTSGVRRHDELFEMLNRLIFWRNQGLLVPSFVDPVTFHLKLLILSVKQAIAEEGN